MEASAFVGLINETRYFWLPAADILLLWWVYRTVRGMFWEGV